MARKPVRKSGPRRPQKPVRPRGREEDVRKIVYAIGFDVFDRRTVLTGPAGVPEPGEPARGVGRLKAPWAGMGDRPLPWARTPQHLPLPPMCPDPAGHVPQPAHGRWTNPRTIVLRLKPGFYSIWLDDLDCSTAKVKIWKGIVLLVTQGACRFTGGADIRQISFRTPVYTEPKGWSLQPSPIIFGGRLIVRDQAPSVIEVTILKCDARKQADGSHNVLGSGGIHVIINP